MRVCITFYRTVAVPLTGITLICAYQVWQAQSVYFVFRVFWVKIIASLLIATYTVLFRSSQFIFYNNLGYSREKILLYAFLFDFLLWLFLMGLLSQLL